MFPSRLRILALGMGLMAALAGDPPPAAGDGGSALLEDTGGRAEAIARDHVAGNVRPSLEMKECVDFLLTPALLIQQSLSEGVIPIYPTE